MIESIINIAASLASAGYYVYHFNKECVTGSQRQTLFTAENPSDVIMCQSEKTPTICFEVETKTNPEKIMNFAYKVYGSNINKSWKEENRTISKWIEPITTPDMKSNSVSEVLHKYRSENWDSYPNSIWIVASKGNIGIAIISPLEEDMRIWKTYIREGEAMWVPKGWFMKLYVEDLAVIV